MSAAVARLYDHTLVQLPDKLLQVQVTKAMLEEKMNALLDRFITIEAVQDGIQTGDIVALEIPDEKGGLKRISINVGKGYWSKATEDALLGLHTGRQGELPIWGKPTAYTIISIKRRVFPVLDDALAVKFAIPGVSTAKELEAHAVSLCAEQLKSGKMQAIVKVVLREVIANSEFESADAAIQATLDSTMAQVNAMAAQNGEVPEKLLPKALGKADMSYEEAMDTLLERCREQVLSYSIGKAYAQADGHEYTREDAAKELLSYSPQLGDSLEHISDTLIDSMIQQHYKQYCSKYYAAYYGGKFQVFVE